MPTIVSVLLGLGLGLAVMPGLAPAEAKNSVPRGIVAFEGQVTDEAINELAARHGARIGAVYTWSTGLTSAYRSDQVLTTREMLNTTRTALAASYREGLNGNTMRITAFIAAHDSAEVTASEALEAEARSLLRIRAELTGALQAVGRGDAIIYAVEVVLPSTERLEAIGRDPSVKAFAARGSGREVAAMKPAYMNVAWQDAEGDAMSSSRIYESLRVVVSGGNR